MQRFYHVKRFGLCFPKVRLFQVPRLALTNVRFMPNCEQCGKINSGLVLPVTAKTNNRRNRPAVSGVGKTVDL